MPKEYPTATSGGGSPRISTLNGGMPGRGLRTTTGQPRATVSDAEATNVSKSMNKAPVAPVRGGSVKAGLTPVSETTGNKSTGPNQLTARPGTTPVKSPVVKSMQTTRTTPADVRQARATERNARLTKALTPIKPRGTKSGGKAMIGPKPNPRTIQVAKPSAATTRNKVVNPPDRNLDESRKVGIKNVQENSRFRQPTITSREPNKPTTEVRDTTKKEFDAQKEADARVKVGLQKIKAGEKGKARPDMPKQKLRAPNYTKRNVAGFKRVTGGTD
jgi:hypothetical protein